MKLMSEIIFGARFQTIQAEIIDTIMIREACFRGR